MRESNSNIDKSSFKTADNLVDKIITNSTKGGLFVFRLPTESYCELNVHSVKYLLDHGCKGVYVSFQRPLKNVSSLFEQFGINKKDVIILDMTRASKNAEEIWGKIRRSLNKFDCKKKFVFIDSITTMDLVKPDFWTDSFSEFLMNITNKKEFDNVILLVNVAKDLINKKIVKNVSSAADGIFNIDRSRSQYSIELIKPERLT